MVRVGGGYLGIGDFIDQYTQQEVEKIERSNVIERFASKTAVQHIAVNQASSAIETSPIR